jgi:hypothetical protein
MSSTESSALTGPLVARLFTEARAHERRRKFIRLGVAITIAVALAVSLTLSFSQSTPSNGLILATPQDSQAEWSAVQSAFHKTPQVAKAEILSSLATALPGVKITVRILDKTNLAALFTSDGHIDGVSEYPPSPYVATQYTLIVVEHGVLGCRERNFRHLSACAGVTFPR